MQTTSSTPRRGRPPGTVKVTSTDVIKRHVHFTVHRHRQPLLAAWLANHDERGLAPNLVDLLERALAGRDVAVAGGGGEANQEVYEVDLSGLADWD